MTEQVEQRRRRLRLTGLQWYSSQAGSPFMRHPSDIALLVVCVVLFAVLLPTAPGPNALDLSLSDTLTSLPVWVTWVFSVGYALAGIWAIVLLLAPLVLRRRRVLTLHLVLAIALAFALAALVS